MFNLFKSNKKYPVFDTLKGYDKQYAYFIRTARWGWLNEKNIFVMDPKGPRVLTLDPWPQLIFLASEGQMTVTDYILHIAGKYTGRIPDILDKTIIDELEKLERYAVIEFSERKQKPDKKFELPIDKNSPS